MDRNAFGQLCYLVENLGKLQNSRNITVSEQVAMFLSVLAPHKINAVVKYDFRRLGQTVSRVFHDVLKVVLRLYPILVVHPKPVEENNNDWKWWRFKGCLGALDGTEGSAANSRVLRDVLAHPDGLRAPTGNYYLCNGGYTNGPGLLTPFRGVRYHLHDFDDGYTGKLKQHICQVVPGSNIKAEPHISSKITVWKKTYGELSACLASMSGIGWSGQSLSVKDDVWEAYVKVEILGKDRAMGEGPQGFADALREPQANLALKITMIMVIRGMGLRIVHPEKISKDAKEQRKQIFEALEPMTQLTMVQRLVVAKYLVKNNDELDLFFRNT
ncbi:retrotransposon protein [Striga asiatica]|uniref:Retrotransposon protein n=1 Tax=Striga asiatica TaxID=4170 RepID=A0A5A7RL09_STRAF|nr:retrotransposon protein [Striga asiatica]